MSTTRQHGHAVIIGASMAGLLAARVLSEHFERVTLVERDVLDDGGADARRGVPQGRHAHVVLVRGEQIMSELFPGLVRSLVAQGATQVAMGNEMRWFHFECWKRRYAGDLSGISVTRPRLEFEVRRRVRALPNVSIIDGTVVTRYLTDWERTHITGVCVRGRGDLSFEDTIHADLVIDASGRGSQTPQRLMEIGYHKPEEELVKVNIEYVTRLYERNNAPREWKALLVADAPKSRRMGLIVPIENNRWMVTLVGTREDFQRIDDDGFLEFTRSLPMPDVHEALVCAKRASKIMRHGFAASQRRYYERLGRFPSGLLVLGDALCSFNPTFGQGMSVTALEAKLLSDCLEELAARRTPSLDALTCNFRSRAGRIVDLPWEMATGEDLRFPQTEGRRNLKLRFIHWYTANLHRAAGESAVVTERFHRVMHMLAPQETLFSREVLTEVLRTAWRTLTTCERGQHRKHEAHQH